MALALCKSRPGPLTRIIEVGIRNRHLPKTDLWTVINKTAELERLRLQKYLSTLAFIGGLSVTIGLLGTVTGMFISIGAVWTTERPDTGATVARGISQALLTTVAGMVVALPAMVAHAYFMAKAGSMIDEMTRHSLTLVRLFTSGSVVADRQELDSGKV